MRKCIPGPIGCHRSMLEHCLEFGWTMDAHSKEHGRRFISKELDEVNEVLDLLYDDDIAAIGALLEAALEFLNDDFEGMT